MEFTRTRSEILTHSRIELKFGNVGFWGEGKTRVPREKPLGAQYRTNNKFNPHVALAPGTEARTYRTLLNE